jgi:hypothetical protein
MPNADVLVDLDALCLLMDIEVDELWRTPKPEAEEVAR